MFFYFLSFPSIFFYVHAFYLFIFLVFSCICLNFLLFYISFSNAIPGAGCGVGFGWSYIIRIHIIAGSGAAAPGALGTPLGIETGGGDLQGNSLGPPCKLFLGGAAAPGALVPPPGDQWNTQRSYWGHKCKTWWEKQDVIREIKQLNDDTRSKTMPRWMKRNHDNETP